MPHKANAACRHHIPRAKRRVTNWAEYDAALRQRGSLTVWFSEEAIAGWKALSRSWVLLVNSARRSQPACLYFNALGHSSPSQIRPEIAYSWPM